MHTRSLMIALIVGLTSSTAYADCPGAFKGLTCDGGTGHNVCEIGPTTVFICHGDANGLSSGATMTVVSGLDDFDYAAWGTDSTGHNFCCEASSDDVERVALFGTPYADTLTLTTTVSGVVYDLANMGTTSRLVGLVSGNGGADTIYGSNTTASSYADSLHGDGDNDTVYGFSGKDEITGDLGDDTIYGGGGDDILHGNDGNDVLYGEGGADTLTGDAGTDSLIGGGDNDVLLGGTGNDAISGSGGDDHMNGDDGTDAICGGNGNDSLCGGADDDQLWGDSGDDMGDGQTGTDACSAEHLQACESTLTTKPATCP